MSKDTQIIKKAKVTIGEPPFLHDPNHPALLAKLERAKKNGSGLSIREREMGVTKSRSCGFPEKSNEL